MKFTKVTSPPAKVRLVVVAAAVTCLGLLTSCTIENSSSAHPNTRASKMLPEEIHDRGYITIVTDAKYPPYGFYDSNGDLTGIDVDTTEALEDVLGIEMRIVTASFDAFIPGLESGRYDAGFNGITDTPDRRKKLDFVGFAKYGSRFLTRADSDLQIKNLTSACGLAVGAENGGDTVEILEALAPDCDELGKAPVDLSVYGSNAAALTALDSGRVETVMTGSAAGYVAKQSDGKLTVDGPLFANPDGSYSTGGLALPKDSPLTHSLVSAMQTLKKDGTLKQIYEQYGIESDLLIEPKRNRGKIDG